MKKSIREKVWLKYDKHCAYCGKDITYNNMQVDHMLPRFEDINNYMPSCRRCNHYKRWRNLEQFRALMLGLHTRINETYIVKVARNYNLMVPLEPFGGTFYFERQANLFDK